MTFEIITYILGGVVVVLGYTTINLLIKNEKAEDIIVSQRGFIENFQSSIEEADKKLKELDTRGSFSSDDEIGWFFNEMLAIQTHDGLYDEANTKYLKAFMPEQKPRTSLPFILHQADLMAARIEFEIEWLPKLKGENSVEPQKNNFTLSSKPKSNTKSKALNTVKSEGLKSMLDSL